MTFKIYVILLLMLFPHLALASDPTGLNVFIFFILSIPAFVIALIIWLINKSSKTFADMKYMMWVPFIILILPVPWENSGVPWPSGFILMAGDLKHKGIALLFILIAFSIIYGTIKVIKNEDELEQTLKHEIEERIRKAEEEKLLKSIQQRTKEL